MIGKVTKGSDFRGVLSYVLDKPGAHFIDAFLLVGEHLRQWVAEFEAIAEQRYRVQYPVAHYSFSPHPDRPMDDSTAYRYAKQFCDRMGHNDCQWLLVRHTDTKTEDGHDRDHFHIVANRVTLHGDRTVSSYNDWYRVHATHQELLEEFDLHPVRPTWETDSKSPSTGQIRRIRRQSREYADGLRDTPPEPILLTQLQQSINRCCADRPTFPEFVDRLHSQNISVRIKPTPVGELGISYKLGEFAASGTSLGRAYTFAGLQRRLGVSYQPQRDNPDLHRLLGEEFSPLDCASVNSQVSERSDRELSPQPLIATSTPAVPDQNSDCLNAGEYQQWVATVAPVLDAYLHHRQVSTIAGRRFRTYKSGNTLVLEYRDGSQNKRDRSTDGIGKMDLLHVSICRAQ